MGEEMEEEMEEERDHGQVGKMTLKRVLRVGRRIYVDHRDRYLSLRGHNRM